MRHGSLLTAPVPITRPPGNVFRDLGFSQDEAKRLLIRADLLIQVQEAMTAQRLPQAATAKLLHVTQPRVSDLLAAGSTCSAPTP